MRSWMRRSRTLQPDNIVSFTLPALNWLAAVGAVLMALAVVFLVVLDDHLKRAKHTPPPPPPPDDTPHFPPF